MCKYVDQMVQPLCWLPRCQQVLHQRQISGFGSIQMINYAGEWGAHWLRNPGQTLPEVQNRDSGGPIKRTDNLQCFLSNKTGKIMALNG